MRFPSPILLLALTSVHAAPLLHVPFSNRTTGSLPGQSAGGQGFASGAVWDGLNSSFGSVVADASTVQSSGLSWGILATDAKHALVKGDDSNTRAMMDVSPTGIFATSGLRDADSNTIGGGAVQGSLYLSFVFRAMGTDRDNEYGGLQLARANSDATGVLIGNGWTPWAYSIHLPENGNSSMDLKDYGGSGNYLQMDNQSHFFVARIDYAANAPDILTVWMDPDLGAPETAQNLSGVYMGTASGDFSFDRFFLRGGTTTRQFEFDEIRMGTTWEDVAPLASAPLSNEHLRVTLREDGTISRLMALREGVWEEIAFRGDNLRGPQWQVTTSGTTGSIALNREAGTSSFSGTRNGQNYRFTYQLNGPSLELVARVENPGGSAWTPERATICLGINSYMEGYPDWNLRYFPTLLRCEKTHFWGYSMSPLGRILGYASKDPVASWRHDYEYGAHRIRTSYLDLLQSDAVPERHPQDATNIPAGQSREWRISLFDIPSLEEAPAVFAAATAAPAIQASRYHGEPGETTKLTIRGPLASLTHNGSPVSFSSSGDTHTATWTFPSTLGEHRILAANAAGKTSECILVTRHPWSWYLKQARTEAINKPQKASTHTESWYGLYSGFLARKHFPDELQDTAIQAKLDELFPLMYDTATSLPTVEPDRVQNHSSMAGVLVDRYQATGDITSLERASILCDYLITKQGADGAYYSGSTHYTSVIYIAKSIMEVMAEEKKLAAAGSPVWQERYDRHYQSVKRAMDDLVARGADIGTEGQHTFEDGMISCSYTQLAEFALLQTDPAQRAIYTNAAVALVEFHRCLSQKLVPDGRLNGGSLRFWESQYDILANSPNMMGSPHGWSAWRLYGLRSLYELTGDPKYLRDAMNGLGSCVQTMHPVTGDLRWGFIVDPSVRAGIFTEFPSNPGKGRCVTTVIGEQYLPMISGWYRAPANTLVSGYWGGNSNGMGLGSGESWPANWWPSGTWGGDGGCCDNDVHEIFKCLEEIALTSAYLIPGPDDSAEVWNGTAQLVGDTLVVTPAEAVVTRVHINRPPGDTRRIAVNFGGELIDAPATGSAWVAKPAVPTAYHLWRLEHFGSGYATNPDAMDHADPDGDRVVNRLEFIMAGRDPNASEPTPMLAPLSEPDQGWFGFSVSRNPAAAPDKAQILVSEDLILWTKATAAAGLGIVVTEDSLTYQAVKVPPSLPRLFLSIGAE